MSGPPDEAPPASRSEGKKQERPAAQPAAPVEVTPALRELPVGVLEPGGADNPHGVGTALAAAGFRQVAFTSGVTLESVRVVVVVPGGTEDVLEQARALAARPGAPPVLLCGGEDDMTLMARAIEGGVYDYVPLPLDPVDLTRKVGRALRSRR